jgi:fructuronate reductase
MAPRLSENTLAHLSANVRRPDYKRADITPGIVHLGIGAFHRAHQALYVDDLLCHHPEWGIIGASLRRPDTFNALAPQDFYYTLAVRSPQGTSCRIIGSVLRVINATEEREQLLGLMADRATRIVSLTITEKGYCHDPATGELDETHPDIVHDLAHTSAPVSAPGLIVEAARRRHNAGIAPFIVLSCDNLPANGKTARRIILGFARRRDPSLALYMENNVTFPSTMVDRIVPATTDEDRAEISDILGHEDAWPVVTEPFSQWVIEDNFPGGRPPFEEAGATMVSDVEPFERMKLRLLNGSHSSLAYLGYLAGFKTVSQVMENPKFSSFLHELMTQEIIPTLDMPEIDLLAYRDALLTRFANPALRHATWQIAMDGSQKLPQRLLDTIRDRMSADQPYERLALGVAGWIRYASGVDEAGSVIDVRDPLAERCEKIAREAGGDSARLVDGFLALSVVFGTDLPQNRDFRRNLVEKVALLREFGAQASLG